MSKKKNTLKDLDEFLKQQAATLVEPASLKDKIEPVAEPTQSAPIVHNTVVSSSPATADGIVQALQELSVREGAAFRKKLYDIIIQSVEKQGASLPEDKMLINTALYLKGGDQWKEVIKEYWKGKH